MQRLSPKLLLVIGLILSIGAAGLVYNYLRTATQSKVAGDPVVVAVQDIPGRTKITAEMVKVITVPADMVQQGSIRDLQQVVGVMTRVPVIAGDQITDLRLAIDGKVPGFVGAIPRDKRALTIAVTDVTGVSGFIKAGDYIDLFITFDKSVTGEHVSQLALENTLVLAANKNDNMDAAKDKKDADKMATVTLAVSPNEALMLALAAEKAKIHLALRPFQPVPGIVPAKTITSSDIVGSFFKVLPQFPAERPAPPVAVISAPAPAPTRASEPKNTGIKIIRGTKSTYGMQ